MDLGSVPLRPARELDDGAREGVHDYADAAARANGGKFGLIDEQRAGVLGAVNDHVAVKFPVTVIRQAERYDITLELLMPLSVTEGVELGELHPLPCSICTCCAGQ